MTFGTIRTASSVVALMSAAAPFLVHAQAVENTGYESEIIVTAQRRAERSIDVPITVTTLSSDQLQTANVDQLTDISRLTPALRFDQGGGFFQPTIRGIGTAVTTSGGGGNVGIYIDGFYSPNPRAANFDLLNVTGIQVLKGPQGTLFGRNTTGGAILVQTAEPSTENGGQIRASYGRFNEMKAQGYLTMGISEKVALDFQGLYKRGDGWLTNISNGKKVGDYENWSARIGLKADFSENVSLLVRYQHAATDDPTPLLTSSYTGPDIASGAPFFAAPGQFTFRRNQVATGSALADQEFARSKSNVLQATLKADLGFANLTSYSQYRQEKIDSSQELDNSGVELVQIGLPNDNETWSQELLLTSKPGTPLQWTAGFFYFSNRDTYAVFTDYSPGGGIFSRSEASRFGSSTTTKTTAAFVDATYEITPSFFVTGGLRYARDTVDDAYWIPPGSFPTRRYVKTEKPENYEAARQGHLTPRFVVRYKPTTSSSIYASYTKGYKAAVLDVGGGDGPTLGAYVRPEKINAFELGYKHEDAALSVEVSGYYYDYKNLQVSLFKDNAGQVVNAASSEIYGLDGQMRYALTDKISVNVGAAWTHARYKRFEDAPIYTPCLSLPPEGAAACGALGVSFPIVPTDLNNVTMQRIPEFTGNLGASYKTGLGGGRFVLSGNLFYSSKLFFGPSGIQFPQKAYEVMSLRAQWTDASDTYTVAAWADNVTNSRYKTTIQYTNYGIGSNWSKPRTFGIELGAKF